MTEIDQHSWLNTKLLQNILRRDHENATVVDFSRSGASEKGDSYLSNMTRCQVQYRVSDEAKQASLIIKNVPTNERVGTFVDGITVFEIEMKVFSETLPKIYEELKKGGKYEDIAAKFYYCRFSDPKILVVQDLTAKGFRMQDRMKGLDLQHCDLVMRKLARFHAGSAVLREKSPSDVECYDNNFHTEGGTEEYVDYYFVSMSEALADAAKNVFPNEESYPGRLLKKGAAMRKDMVKLLTPKISSFNCLIHGDLWLNNMMFKYDETTGDVSDVRFLDFQFAKYAPAVNDIQYFLHSSATEEVRINHVRELLITYHSELTDTFHSLGYREKVLTFEELLDDYKNHALYGFFAGIFVLPMFLANQCDAFEWEKLLQKSDDYDGHYKRITNELYIPVFKRLLPMFSEAGVF